MIISFIAGIATITIDGLTAAFKVKGGTPVGRPHTYHNIILAPIGNQLYVNKNMGNPDSVILIEQLTQALVLLDEQHLAHTLLVGTTSGEPFYILDGEALTFVQNRWGNRSYILEQGVSGYQCRIRDL